MKRTADRESFAEAAPYPLSRRTVILRTGGLAAGAGLAAVAGCGPSSGQPAAAPVASPALRGTLRFGLPGSDVNHPPEMFQAFAEDYPHIAVEKEFAPWSDFFTKLGGQLAADQAPDLWWGEDGRALGYGAQGAAKDLTPLIRRDLRREDYYGLDNPRDVAGHTWGVPGVLQEIVLYYNTAAFDEAGVKYPTASWTLDDLVDAARRLTQPAQRQYGFYLQPQYITSSWYLFPRLFGGDVLDPTRTKAQFTHPKVLQAYEFMVDLLKRGVVPPVADQGKYPFASTEQAQGRSAMTFALYVFIRSGAQKAGLTTYDVDVVPRGPAARWTSLIANCWIMWAKSRQADAAWAFLRWHSGEKVQTLRANLGQGLPVHRKAADQLVRTWNPPPKNIAAFVKSFAFSGSLGLNASWADWYPAAGEELLPAWRGEMSVAEAAGNATRRVQQIMDDFAAAHR